MKYKIINVLGYILIFASLFCIVFYTYLVLSDSNREEKLNNAVTENVYYEVNKEIALIKDFYSFYSVTTKNEFNLKRNDFSKLVSESILEEYWGLNKFSEDSISYFVEDIKYTDLDENTRQYRIIMGYPNDSMIKYSEVYIKIEKGYMTEIKNKGVISI